MILKTLRYELTDGIATITFDEQGSPVNTMCLQWQADLTQAAEQVADLSGDVTDQPVAESMIDSSAELHAGAAAQGLTLPAEGSAVDASASDRP